jgi:hypothetical protein
VWAVLVDDPTFELRIQKTENYAFYPPSIRAMPNWVGAQYANAIAWFIGDKEMTDAQAHYSGRNGRRSSDRLCLVDVQVGCAKNCG